MTVLLLSANIPLSSIFEQPVHSIGQLIMKRLPENRREFLTTISTISVGAYVGIPARGLEHSAEVSFDRFRPNITHGVSTGDVTTNRAVVWSRADRPSRMIVEVAATESFTNAQRIRGPEVLQSQDFTGKVMLRDLPPGSQLFYRVMFQDLANQKRFSAPVIGQLKTASVEKRSITFGWAGDTAGQGYGIDESRGGMKTYDTMTTKGLDFFVHSGDVCYADGPFESEIQLDDGSQWKNLVTEGTSKVAETIEEFRSNYRYNLLDKRVRQFNAHVPVFAQWDDHETTNNWYPGEQLDGDDRYTVKSASLLAARARQAFLEYMPLGLFSGTADQQQIYRKIPYGPLLELFFLDLRSFRGANSANMQTESSQATDFMGSRQLTWLKQQLLECQSTWKFICSDMPIGLVVSDGSHYENSSNGDAGQPRGRELEIASLLKFIKDNQIRNVVFITADVHYAASHYYDPNNAGFSDFEPFWEFVSGPLHAGTFGPGKFDMTFGPEQRFCSLPEGMKQNRSPADGLQFFGVVKIDSETEIANVAHFNQAGEQLWQIDLEPLE